ncbi:phosphatase PAP2 family protein [Halobacillus yeomjeoni]|uniref:phosphatase PAP2 family protein n=1 Tax=Halobacillus yeomjeoni TaxID=311194 RepID=UPI001CD59215|nr:phosphatase PAP2 family protein [Halobacillus yeomjeoni]MCA0984059.1 phosphatase PAP2 family protein [Halobacillus yeomjeoni]
MLFSGTKVSDLSKASVFTILIGFITIGVAFNLFFELADQVMEDEKFLIDQWAIDVVVAIQSGWLDQTFTWITETGSVWWITTASIILVVYLFLGSAFSRWVAVYFIINMLGISALTKLLKLYFERQRPEVLAEYDGTGFSFPSGHSTGAIVFYGFLVYLVTITHWKKSLKWILNSFLVLLILAVGLSRVYLGVHYLTDILAGFLFGLAWLFVCISALEMTLWNQRRRRK